MRLYYKACSTAWSGDETGREWMLGFSVVPNVDSDPERPFAVYEDDGRGNGNFVADYPTLELAKAAVDRLVVRADEHGWAAMPNEARPEV